VVSPLQKLKTMLKHVPPEEIPQLLASSQEGLPDIDEKPLLSYFDRHAIVIRTLVKSLGITSDELLKSIRYHEARRGREIVGIYEGILLENGLIEKTDLPFRGVDLLEFGAGPNAVALAFQEKGARVISFDIRDGRVLHSESNPFVMASGYSLPFETGFFDAVSQTSVLHHLESPKNGILEVLRVLKTGGVLFIQEDLLSGNLLRDKLMRIVDDAVSGEIGSSQQRTHGSKEEWLQLFSELGLDLIGEDLLKPSFSGVSIDKGFFVLRKKQ